MTYDPDRISNRWLVLLTTILVSGLLFCIFVPPYFEAKTYNKYRKPGQPEATYCDAFFANLRVSTE